jgi:hypothetical protein
MWDPEHLTTLYFFFFLLLRFTPWAPTGQGLLPNNPANVSLTVAVFV